MNWWLMLIIFLVFVGSIISFFIGWYTGRKYQEKYDEEVIFKKLKESKDE